jgi:DNA-binding CsgD family transcriptional regulator
MLDPFLGAALIDAAGGDDFAPLLLDAANGIAGVDEIFAYRATAAGAPDALLSVSKLDDAGTRAQNYVRDFFRFDPVTRVRTSGRSESFVVSVSASELKQPRYRSLCFDGPRFADKLCFGWRDKANAIVLSFYRSDAGGLAHERGLLPLANLALSILAKQAKTVLPLVERLEHKLAHHYPELTMRERQVCARTIAGWSAERSAADLGIRPSTVIAYRQRAYQRLGIHSAHAFLEPMIH